MTFCKEHPTLELAPDECPGCRAEIICFERTNGSSRIYHDDREAFMEWVVRQAEKIDATLIFNKLVLFPSRMIREFRIAEGIKNEVKTVQIDVCPNQHVVDVREIGPMNHPWIWNNVQECHRCRKQ